MANKPAILAEGLEKQYGKTRALAGLDLSAEEGSVLAVLGPNGAGKTTAVRILTTLLRPDAGRAEVAGLDVVRDADALGRASASPASTPPSMRTSQATKIWRCSGDSIIYPVRRRGGGRTNCLSALT